MGYIQPIVPSNQLKEKGSTPCNGSVFNHQPFYMTYHTDHVLDRAVPFWQ